MSLAINDLSRADLDFRGRGPPAVPRRISLVLGGCHLASGVTCAAPASASAAARTDRRSIGYFVRSNSMIQFVSHVLPGSLEKACSHRVDLGVMRDDQMKRTRIGFPSCT